ncbi:pirin [Paenibacillus swuensis]|uniref:Pirin n=1 Tax=Paenibacillus swuensis TaxID=1178515 RepID=A0A172TDY4_9BACL|nr:pirin family protein [Paenibacillus swuensis]ANE45117.1 pirin [Paenibacillus swuensis]
MISVYPASSRYSADHGWLQSHFSFSFADYYDSDNMNFGPLRVLNDDIIAAGKGFGMHPHREMEIVSVVLRGQLQHQDSLGHTAVTTYGQIQRMSAGKGVMHSEFNPSENEDMNLLQMWFMPNQEGVQPSYETTTYDLAKTVNILLPIVSHQSSAEVAHIHQDMTMYMSRLEQGKEISFNQAQNRRIFVFVTEGEITINGSTQLHNRDSARITETTALNISSVQGGSFILIDLP